MSVSDTDSESDADENTRLMSTFVEIRDGSGLPVASPEPAETPVSPSDDQLAPAFASPRDQEEVKCCVLVTNARRSHRIVKISATENGARH